MNSNKCFTRSNHKTLKRKHDNTLQPVEVMHKKLKVSRQKSRRLKKKVESLNNVVKSLTKNNLISEQSTSVLWNTFEGIPAEVLKRAIEHKSKNISKSKYPEVLKAFALTLQFYSTKAYNYVRRSFQLALPHPSTIRRWYQSIDGKPGFTQEAFAALSSRVKDSKTKGEDIICGIMVDEMAIRKHLQWDGHKFQGFVDTGTVNNDASSVASEALTFMAVSLNSSWKIPLGYFLIDGMTSVERANLVKICLLKLNDIGVKTVSLTCDGPSTNQAMLKVLGAKLDVLGTSQPYFLHPGDATQKVYVMIDICHMLKLVRNTLATQGQFSDGDGGIVQWNLVEELHKLQEDEGLRLGNKLQSKHIRWEKQKMKVNLAAQTISASVADAIEVCDNIFGIPAFSKSAATVKFIRTFDHLFDIFNSRNPLARNYKSPLRISNKNTWGPFLQESYHYIMELKDMNGTPLHKTKWKTGFVGFLCAIQTIQGLFADLIATEKPVMKYLLTYKLSQDHLELFFAAVRSCGRWNNNPTASQFMAAYKRLLIRHEIKSSGNSTAQDDTSILFLTKDQINSTCKKTDIVDIAFIRRHDLATKAHSSDPEDDDLDSLPNLGELSNFKTAAVGYIAGFVVRKMQRTIHCHECLAALQNESPDEVNYNILVRHKTNGGLTEASASVFEICRSTECCLVRMLRSNTGQLPQSQSTVPTVQSIVLEEVVGKGVFSTLEKHMFDSPPDSNHMFCLIKCIIQYYMEVRLHHLAKQQTAVVKGELLRRKLSKLILFKNQ